MMSGDEDDDDEDDDGLEDDEEYNVSEEELKRLRALEADEIQFPNEVQTPRDIAAYERFARYRGLKSFRATPWNPKESLPRSYSRTSQFRDFRLAQRRVLEAAEKAEKAMMQREIDRLLSNKSRTSDAKSVASSQASAAASSASAGAGTGAGAGGKDIDMEEDDVDTNDGEVSAATFVCIHLAAVPVARAAALPKDMPLLVGGLLKYENKLSVVHYNITRVGWYSDPIKSKVTPRHLPDCPTNHSLLRPLL